MNVTSLTQSKLSYKVIAAIVAVVLIVVPMVGYYSVTQVRQTIEKAYLDKAFVTSRLLDAGIRTLADIENTNTLFETVQRHLWLEPNTLAIEVARVDDGKLSVVVADDSRRLGQTASQDNLTAFGQDQLVWRFIGKNDERFIRVITPIHVAQRPHGTFQLDISLEPVNAQIKNTVFVLIVGYALIILIVSVLVYLLIRRIVLNPIKKLGSSLSTVAESTNCQVSAASNDEIGRLARSFNKLSSELTKSHRRADYLSFHDPLTGLPNRRIILDRMELSIARSLRSKKKGVFMYLDIDHFKDINDSFGHAVGDELLVLVAKRLSESLRVSDTVARLGGDEFAVLLDEREGNVENKAKAVAEKLASWISREMVIKDQKVFVSLSIGMCLFPSQGDDVSRIIRKADTALYHAKATGRNRVVMFTSDMQIGQERKSKLRRELNLAVKKQEFFLVYQPQVDSENSLVGLEALIRWQHPHRGVLSPDQFIPVAEESDLICSIGEWVLREACSQYRKWVDREGMDSAVVLSVNVSPRQFHQIEFVSMVEKIITETEMDPRQLDLEVTESTLLNEPHSVIEKMNQLIRRGIQFSLDDFGTGYSSLTYLRQLPVSRVKIDRSFITDLDNDEGNTSMVETILSIAQQYRLEVVSEGVETRNQKDCLAEKGCQFYQGYYFDKPLTPEQVITRRLNSNKLSRTIA